MPANGGELCLCSQHPPGAASRWSRLLGCPVIGIINRIDAKRDFSPDIVQSSAKLIRTFVDDYQEKLEEDYLFPRFRKAKRLVELVDVLNQQHQKGRALTDRTMELATAGLAKDVSRRVDLRDVLHHVVRMYEPHEAREDTVLFPALRKIVSKHEYDARRSRSNLGFTISRRSTPVLPAAASRLKRCGPDCPLH